MKAMYALQNAVTMGLAMRGRTLREGRYSRGSGTHDLKHVQIDMQLCGYVMAPSIYCLRWGSSVFVPASKCDFQAYMHGRSVQFAIGDI